MNRNSLSKPLKHALTFAFWSENLNDLYLLDPASPSSLGWVNLDENTKGAAPSPRNGHGFVALGSLLYVFGGMVGPQLQCKNGVIITNCRKIVEQVIFFRSLFALILNVSLFFQRLLVMIYTFWIPNNFLGPI